MLDGEEGRVKLIGGLAVLVGDADHGLVGVVLSDEGDAAAGWGWMDVSVHVGWKLHVFVDALRGNSTRFPGPSTEPQGAWLSM